MSDNVKYWLEKFDKWSEKEYHAPFSITCLSSFETFDIKTIDIENIISIFLKTFNKIPDTGRYEWTNAGINTNKEKYGHKSVLCNNGLIVWYRLNPESKLLTLSWHIRIRDLESKITGKVKNIE